MESLCYLAGGLILTALLSVPLDAQTIGLKQVNHGHSLLDAHNCYPYDGRWTDRVDRALRTGFPVAIEQDVAWYVDPSTGIGRAVVTHSEKTNSSNPTLRDYFFEHVRPIIERALADGDKSRWPLIVVHFDFKDNQVPLLRAVWALLGEYEAWITTAPKNADPRDLASLDIKPLLVLTEDSDAQENVFYTERPVGSKLRLFGSAHTHMPQVSQEEKVHLAATLPPDQLLAEPPTDYRRWWNNAWGEVEEGGQQHAGAWTPADDARLYALVSRAHELGYWIRFYTLDGFEASAGKEHGWFESYNFGSLAAAQERWRAALNAGVDMIATDQYEDLAEFMRSSSAHR